jgi:aminopeptidase N
MKNKQKLEDQLSDYLASFNRAQLIEMLENEEAKYLEILQSKVKTEDRITTLRNAIFFRNGRID